jgi:hypothetical protein
MAHPLVELSRTQQPTGQKIVLENYDLKPRLCRHGTWVGVKFEFVETVTLSFEHDPEELYVGWSINGTTVVDPGYGPFPPPFGAPVPGEPSVTYRTPVAGLYHRISFTSTAGHDEECLSVTVLYRTPAEAGAPAHVGPSRSVCLSGGRVDWPAYLLKAEQECLRHWYEILRRYVRVLPPWPPPPPLSRWLERVQPDDLLRFKLELETLEQLDPEADRELAEAIVQDLSNTVTLIGMPGSMLGRKETQ